MTRYALSRVMWEITRDRALADAFRACSADVLDGRELDAAERAALEKSDVRGLFELGVHPFVLYHFALRLAGGMSLQFMQGYLDEIKGLTVGDLET